MGAALPIDAIIGHASRTPRRFNINVTLAQPASGDTSFILGFVPTPSRETLPKKSNFALNLGWGRLPLLTGYRHSLAAMVASKMIILIR